MIDLLANAREPEAGVGDKIKAVRVLAELLSHGNRSEFVRQAIEAMLRKAKV